MQCCTDWMAVVLQGRKPLVSNSRLATPQCAPEEPCRCPVRGGAPLRTLLGNREVRGPAKDCNFVRQISEGCVLCCDENFDIVDVDDAVYKLLRYTKAQLQGRSIKSLMSPVVASVHRDIFADLASKTQPELCHVARQLMSSGHSKCRAFAVLGADGHPVVCKVQVKLNEDRSSKVVLLAKGDCEDQLLCTVPVRYERFIHQPAGLHVDDYADVTCIMMDIANSTAFALSVSPMAMARLLHSVFVIAQDVVMREAFPYAYIHEVLGDSIFILVNADFMVRYPRRSAAISFHLAVLIQRKVDEYLADHSQDLFLRVGMCSGPLCAGVVDGCNFRVFGATVHKAQRLESLCERGCLMVGPNFYPALQEQVQQQLYSIQPCHAEVKGFGIMSCAKVLPSPVQLFCD